MGGRGDRGHGGGCPVAGRRGRPIDPQVKHTAPSAHACRIFIDNHRPTDSAPRNVLGCAPTILNIDTDNAVKLK